MLIFTFTNIILKGSNLVKGGYKLFSWNASYEMIPPLPHNFLFEFSSIFSQPFRAPLIYLHHAPGVATTAFVVLSVAFKN